MPENRNLLKFSRQVHLYFGLLISPALLFFAFTGAMQTLSLHEAAGNSYRPPTWLAVWGQIHKNQTWLLPQRRPEPGSDGAPSGHPPVPSGLPSTAPAAPGSSTRPGADGAIPPAPATVDLAAPPSRPSPTLRSKQRQHLPLKIFFLLVSLGLFTSTFTGIYMAYRYERSKLLVTGLLLAGALLPLFLLPF